MLVLTWLLFEPIGVALLMLLSIAVLVLLVRGLNRSHRACITFKPNRARLIKQRGIYNERISEGRRYKFL
jgi:hypothetical protein